MSYLLLAGVPCASESTVGVLSPTVPSAWLRRPVPGHLHALAWACLILSIWANAGDLPSVTPYRPSVSTPALLSAPGWLEVEAGIQSSRGDEPLRRASLPYSLKLAFTRDWGVRISGDAWAQTRTADGSTLRGGGDTTVVLKRRFEVDDASAFGFELASKLPSAARGSGSGHPDIGINGIYSLDFAKSWHTDINLLETHIGGAEGGRSPWQTAWATALSRNLSERWSAVGELSGTQQGGNASTTQALAAVSYAWSRVAVVDLGVSRGLNKASGTWSVFTGITFLAAHLF